MTAPKDSSYRLLWWILGLAMTLPMILLCGPLAGYFFGYVLVNKLHLPGFLLPLLIAVGLAGSAGQIFFLIRKLMMIQKSQSRHQENKD